jgi:hypothetical protein
MLRNSFIVTALFVLTTVAVGQPAKEQPYQVPQPQGWNKETIKLPPPFAPTMTWKGTEELRFPPMWFKEDSDKFFSYGMFFWLPDDQKVDAKTMEKELLAYYRGLAKGLLARKMKDVDVSAFTLTLKDAAEKPAKRASGGPVTAFAGEMKWTEPFTTVKPQTLRLDIHIWHSDKHKHHCIFICASPQPDTADVWKALHEIRAGVTCP